MVTAFVAILACGLLVVTGLVVDGGIALTAEVTAMSQAEDAARAGAQAVDLPRLRTNRTVTLDPAAARQGAQDYLAAAGAHGSAQATTQQVTVRVTDTVHTALLTLVGIGTLTVHADATAHAVQTGGGAQ
jgi:hypothetical protein